MRVKYDPKEGPAPYGFDKTEQLIWEISPSQLINFWFYIGYALFILSFIYASVMFDIRFLWPMPIFFLTCLHTYLETRSIKYVLTNRRIIIIRGVFRRIMNDIELYKVAAVQLNEPFYRRVWGLGNIQVILRKYYFVMKGVPKAYDHKEKLRYYVEQRKTEKGVIEWDRDET